MSQITAQSLLGAAVLVLVFAASRIPTTTALARSWDLPPSDARALRAVVGRGLTDTVLVLYAISIGVIPMEEASMVANLLFLVVLLGALVSAVLVVRAQAAPSRGPTSIVPMPPPPPPLDEDSMPSGPDPKLPP